MLTDTGGDDDGGGEAEARMGPEEHLNGRPDPLAPTAVPSPPTTPATNISVSPTSTTRPNVINNHVDQEMEDGN